MIYVDVLSKKQNIYLSFKNCYFEYDVINSLIVVFDYMVYLFEVMWYFGVDFVFFFLFIFFVVICYFVYNLFFCFVYYFGIYKWFVVVIGVRIYVFFF